MTKGKFDQALSLTPGDYELVTWLTEQLGYNRSEVMRMSIWMLARQMKAIEKDLEKRKRDAAEGP